MSQKSNLEAEFDYAIRVLGSDLRKPEEGYVFHPSRKWHIDRAWITEKVGVSIEGGGHGRRVRCHGCHVYVRAIKGDGTPGREIRIGGWHARRTRYLSDIEKYNALNELGWVHFRFTNEDIVGDPFEMVNQIRNALTSRGHRNELIDKPTPDEINVLLLIAAGFTTNQIAEQLNEAKHTISSRVQSVCQKLFCHNRASTVARAISWGLMDITEIPWRSETGEFYGKLEK